ncbi:MAG: N-acetyl-gamma-glutamyl-phosphate reductase [Candidatus Omnitrophica bacterium]|nr:N-acetyl-gamma-glutamyl-phosphate reductase [Candidatus Omnitrophota bacterium]
MKKVAILGATGFTGEKLVELLLSHPEVEITYLSSRTAKPVAYASLFPRFTHRLDVLCSPLDISAAAKKADIFFLSLPHTVSMRYVPELLRKNKKVIDLSADYRFPSAAVYKKYFNTAHLDKKNLSRAVYGICELNRNQITGADLIANPGCYATSVSLALYPLVKNNAIMPGVWVDAKSSVTGAGRKALIEYHYANIEGNIWAYKPFTHQHVPEIEQTLAHAGMKLKIKFIPHIVGIEGGIYSTIHVEFNSKATEKKVLSWYRQAYRQAHFIRVDAGLPALKNVIGTNFCDVGFALSPNGKEAVVASCIDNLVKGAAGAAVQNMNIQMGWDETAGLR